MVRTTSVALKLAKLQTLGLVLTALIKIFGKIFMIGC